MQEHLAEAGISDFDVVDSSSRTPRPIERDYFLTEESNEDIWAPARRRKSSSGVGVMGWIVLVMGLALAGFLLYAMFKGGQTTPKAPPPPGIRSGQGVELPLSHPLQTL